MPDPFGRKRRNLTEELLQGASDGALKKPRPDVSNRSQDPTDSARGLLSKVWGGYDWSPYEPDIEAYLDGYVRGA